MDFETITLENCVNAHGKGFATIINDGKITALENEKALPPEPTEGNAQ